MNKSYYENKFDALSKLYVNLMIDYASLWNSSEVNEKVKKHRMSPAEYAEKAEKEAGLIW